jgi:tRNA nucleotidyltransferase (CCA-adding enzyme)
MDLVLCHTTADFDTLGAAVGVSRLQPGTKIVLTGGCHPGVRDFLALHRDEYPLIERRSVNPAQIRSLTVVDTQWRDRLGKAAEWLDLPNVSITLYDHHGGAEATAGDILATQRIVEAVGSTCTLIVERLQAQQILLNTVEATVMALGIHVDTGSLTYDGSTWRDALALAWLMQQGANQRAVAEYVEQGLSTQLQDLVPIALDQMQMETQEGWAIAWVLLSVDGYIQGLSSLASQLLSLTDSDVLLLGARYPISETGEERLTVIGRSRPSPYQTDSNPGVNLGALFQLMGGGGHRSAASMTLRGVNASDVLTQLVEQVKAQLPHPPCAEELMSSPVRTIRPETTIAEAQRILLRYGHSGLSVVDSEGQLVGIISRRDLDIALHHDFQHAPVKGFMTTNVKTITPMTTLPEIEALMVTYDIGRLPVLAEGNLIGIVTRTDVLRQLHQEKLLGRRPDFGNDESWASPFLKSTSMGRSPLMACPLPGQIQALLRDRLTPELWQVLQTIAELAESRGWQLYLVGGAVRDLLLADDQSALMMDDIDLVVDGFHRTADNAAGVELARALQYHYPQARLQVHGRFQTAALLWHHDPVLDSLWVDIATARTEFYPYPAANPEVEASSIRQDLYRRDFTINALAIRLTQPRQGELLDFFGGLLDLQAKQIRVLHTNSFIEDPTRIFRAVRFAVRLGFSLDPQTESSIRHAIASGIYHRIQQEMDRTPALQTRLKQELKYILQATYWNSAIRLLDDLGALCCLHHQLTLSDRLWKRLRLVDRWLKHFDRQGQLEHWQVLLEVILAHLPTEARTHVAVNLQLSSDSVNRLKQLETLSQQFIAAFPHVQRPSAWVKLLSPYSLPDLTLIAATSPRFIRRPIWHYLTHLAQVKPPLNGRDLQQMGYKPGKQFRQMLDRLLDATLDGEVSDRTDAEVFLRTYFPVESSSSPLP